MTGIKALGEIRTLLAAEVDIKLTCLFLISRPIFSDEFVA
jgi:hypothetical protein